MTESKHAFTLESGTFELRTRVYPLSHKYEVRTFKATIKGALDELYKAEQKLSEIARRERPSKLGRTSLNANLVSIIGKNKRNNRCILRTCGFFEDDKPVWRVIYSLKGFKERFEKEYLSADDSQDVPEEQASVQCKGSELPVPCARCNLNPSIEISNEYVGIKCPHCDATKIGGNYDITVAAWNKSQEEMKVVNEPNPIADMCDKVKRLLLDKNRKYGNSALEPRRVFSKADPVEQLKVRIDDKLSRIQSGQMDEDEDVYLDLVGYLILLMVAKEKEKNERRADRGAEA